MLLTPTTSYESHYHVSFTGQSRQIVNSSLWFAGIRVNNPWDECTCTCSSPCSMPLVQVSCLNSSRDYPGMVCVSQESQDTRTRGMLQGEVHVHVHSPQDYPGMVCVSQDTQTKAWHMVVLDWASQVHPQII